MRDGGGMEAIIVALGGAVAATLGGITMLVKAMAARRREAPSRRIENLIREHERCKTHLLYAERRIEQLLAGQSDQDSRVTALEETVKSLGARSKDLAVRSNRVRTRSTDR